MSVQRATQIAPATPKTIFNVLNVAFAAMTSEEIAFSSFLASSACPFKVSYLRLDSSKLLVNLI